MPAFKVIQVDNNDAGTIRRIQENVSTKFAEIDSPTQTVVLPIVSSQTIKTYSVNPSDQYIVVDARGGPIKVVLPVPARATQVVAIKSGYNSNSVTIVQADGNPMGDGAASIDITKQGAAFMVNSGKAWWNFG